MQDCLGGFLTICICLWFFASSVSKVIILTSLWPLRAEGLVKIGEFLAAVMEGSLGPGNKKNSALIKGPF